MFLLVLLAERPQDLRHCWLLFRDRNKALFFGR